MAAAASTKLFFSALTEDAGEGGGGPDLAPQKFLLSQKFRHLMRCKKYLENFFTLLSFRDTAVCLHFWGKFQNGRQRSRKGH